MIELSRELAPVLDRIAGSLEEVGYRVERVPFLFGGAESRDSRNVEDAERAGYPMLTYNNVLVEDDVEGPVVYLPAYGLEALDRVRPARDRRLQTSAMYGGGLRCAVKVLSR
jgi:hypothetical protein